MKPLEKMAVLALLTLGFCGCTRTSEVKAEEKIAVQEEVKARSTEQTAETVQTGPETITTTVEEYEEPENATGSAPVSRVEPVGKSDNAPMAHPTAEGATIRPPGVLVKRTVVVDQRGPVLDTKSAVTQTAKTASLTGKQESTSDTKKSTKWGVPRWLWALGACGVALGIAIVRKTLLGKAVAAAEAAAKEVL